MPERTIDTGPTPGFNRDVANQRESESVDRSSRGDALHRALIPLRVLFRLAAGLSVVNLAVDFNWVSLRGAIARWVESYDHMVTTAADFLFGWIPVSWININDREAHQLVLASVLFVPFLYAVSALEDEPRDEGEKPGNTAQQGLGAFVLAFLTIFLLLSPDEPFIPIAEGLQRSLMGAANLVFAIIFLLLGALMVWIGGRARNAYLGNVAWTFGFALVLVLGGSFLS